MKYLVTWMLAIWMPTPCPDMFTQDEYGREIIYGCLVNHGDYEYEERNRVLY